MDNLRKRINLATKKGLCQIFNKKAQCIKTSTEVGSSKQGYIDELQMFDKSLKVAFFLGNVQGMTLLKDRIDMPPRWGNS